MSQGVDERGYKYSAYRHSLSRAVPVSEWRAGDLFMWHDEWHEIEEISPEFHGSVFVKVRNGGPWDFELDFDLPVVRPVARRKTRFVPEPEGETP